MTTQCGKSYSSLYYQSRTTYRHSITVILIEELNCHQSFQAGEPIDVGLNSAQRIVYRFFRNQIRQNR